MHERLREIRTVLQYGTSNCLLCQRSIVASSGGSHAISVCFGLTMARVIEGGHSNVLLLSILPLVTQHLCLLPPAFKGSFAEVNLQGL
jgi:hypothetical protein